jgi:hypothetical protein
MKRFDRTRIGRLIAAMTPVAGVYASLVELRPLALMNSRTADSA